MPRYDEMVECPACRGSGEDVPAGPDHHGDTCGLCHGRGRVNPSYAHWGEPGYQNSDRDDERPFNPFGE